MRAKTTSTPLLVRMTFALLIAFGMTSLWQMHSVTLRSLRSDNDHSESHIETTVSTSTARETIEKHERKYHSNININSNNGNTKKDNKNDADNYSAAVIPLQLQTLQRELKDHSSMVKIMETSLREFGNEFIATIERTEKRSEEYHQQVEDVQNFAREVREASQESRNNVIRSAQTINSVVHEIVRLQAAAKAKAGTAQDETKPTTTTTTATRLKVHMWDDSQTEKSPREHLLVNDGWTHYNGDDASTTPPWFEWSDDPWEADLILWITVMACHECEVGPTHPRFHAHKVIILDFADGCNTQKTRDELRGNRTELAYFKRSFVYKLPDATFEGNCTQPEDEIIPYAYSGSKVMMIPHDSPEAVRDFSPILTTDLVDNVDRGQIYGVIPPTPKSADGDDNANDNANNDTPKSNDDHGYFRDARYDNFLVPFQDRKWTVTNLLRINERNMARTNVVQWTHEHSKERAGDPRNEADARAAGYSYLADDKDQVESSGKDNSYTAYIGEVDNLCNGYCFGKNMFRHLRDAKIVVTCNPSNWEGDFRTWEAFLSGALVMVDPLHISPWMSNPLVDGTHFVVYDPNNRTDFVTKLSYYSDPANAAEAEAIAKRGYEFVLRHHMAVNRVEYILEKVRHKLNKFVGDPVKRALFRLS